MRNRWVDYAKGLGIILVVYGHVARGVMNAGMEKGSPALLDADSVIYSFHMPLFFFLAGLFFLASMDRRDRPTLIASKVDTVLYPYLVWSIIQGLTEVLLSRYTNGQVTLADVFGLLWAPRAQFWFLYSLFQVFVLATLVYFRRNRFFLLAVAICTSAFALIEPQASTWGKVLALVANFSFFAFGVYFNSIQAWVMARRDVLLALALLAFVAAQWAVHGNAGVYGQGGMFAFGLALLGIALTCTAAMCLSRWRLPWLAVLGEMSLVIYLMHVLAAASVRIVLQKFLGVDNAGLHLVVGTLAGLLLPVLAYALAMRWGMGWLFAMPRALSAEAAWARLTRRPAPAT